LPHLDTQGPIPMIFLSRTSPTLMPEATIASVSRSFLKISSVECRFRFFLESSFADLGG
jgi:hypothetical protein